MPIIPGQAPAPPPAGPAEGSGRPADASGDEESGYFDMPAIGPSREPDEDEEAGGDFGGLPPIGLPDGRGRELPGIIIGTELAARLHAGVGREVTVVNPDGQLLPSGPAPLSRPFLVVATFYTGMIEFDSRFAYVLLPEAQDLLRMSEDEITAIDVRVPSLDDANEVEAELDTALARAGFEGILVRGWETLNKSLFSALKLEKITMFVILTIVILVASFSIASSLLVTVIERAPEIAILKTMGATNGSVMGIFAIAGGLIGLMGTVLGLLAGVGTCLFIEHAGVPMDTEVYYIEYLPVQMVTGEIVMTALAGIVISLLATLYPARKAAQLNPATALRYD
jgi:lipoprotein-releasing system permease protein